MEEANDLLRAESGHGGAAAEEPDGGGQVHEPAGGAEPWAAGEEPRGGRWEGPAGEGAAAAADNAGVREEELQRGLRGDPWAARY